MTPHCIRVGVKVTLRGRRKRGHPSIQAARRGQHGEGGDGSVGTAWSSSPSASVSSSVSKSVPFGHTPLPGSHLESPGNVVKTTPGRIPHLPGGFGASPDRIRPRLAGSGTGRGKRRKTEGRWGDWKRSHGGGGGQDRRSQEAPAPPPSLLPPPPSSPLRQRAAADPSLPPRFYLFPA